jgi:hypothetical protein
LIGARLRIRAVPHAAIAFRPALFAFASVDKKQFSCPAALLRDLT